jgi:hypothetical protein
LFACANPHVAFDCAATLVLDVFQGTAAALRSRSPAGGCPANWAEWHDFAECYAQFYNLLEVRNDGLRIESDFQAVKPLYYAVVDGGAVVATFIRDMVHPFPQLIDDPDELGVCEYLLFSTALYGRTVHRSIRRSQTGMSIRWTVDGLAVDRNRRFIPPPVDVEIGVPQAVERIKTLTGDVMLKRLKNAHMPAVIGLSGGFDSRFIAGMACEKKIPLRAYTYGESYHTEIQCARAVARRLGLTHTIIPSSPETVFANFGLLLEHTEAQGDMMMVQITELLEAPEQDGTPLLHGYFGGALSGAHMYWLSGATRPGIDEFARDIVLNREQAMALRGLTVAQATGLRVTHEDLIHDIATNLIPGALTHQLIVLFDCDNRQQRSIGGQMAMLGSKFHMVTPSYDREVWNAYFSLPRFAMDDRYILRRIYSTYFPDLAAIPHAEEEYPIVPKIRTMFRFAVRNYRHAAARKLLGPQLYEAWIQQRRDPYIWRMSYGAATPALRKRMLSSIESSRSRLMKRFHINADDISRVLPADTAAAHTHLARRMFALNKYAEWLESKAGRFAAIVPGAG